MTLASCASNSKKGEAHFGVGKCIEMPWGAYIYQVAEASNDTYFLYKMGYMGKEIVKLPFEAVHKDYQEIPCP